MPEPLVSRPLERGGRDPRTARPALREDRPLYRVWPIPALAHTSENLEPANALARRIIASDHHRSSASINIRARTLGASNQPRKVGSRHRLRKGQPSHTQNRDQNHRAEVRPKIAGCSRCLNDAAAHCRAPANASPSVARSCCPRDISSLDIGWARSDASALRSTTTSPVSATPPQWCHSIKQSRQARALHG